MKITKYGSFYCNAARLLCSHHAGFDPRKCHERMSAFCKSNKVGMSIEANQIYSKDYLALASTKPSWAPTLSKSHDRWLYKILSLD